MIVEGSEAKRVLLEKMLAPHCAVESARDAEEGLRKFIGELPERRSVCHSLYRRCTFWNGRD